uniref:Uncharacterized protein n=1 Tax=Ditylenchus dipsaci TaxID=166011 RepID=A0A915E0D6_9BILA
MSTMIRLAELLFKDYKQHVVDSLQLGPVPDLKKIKNLAKLFLTPAALLDFLKTATGKSTNSRNPVDFHWHSSCKMVDPLNCHQI